jgi:hypothetical protein
MLRRPGSTPIESAWWEAAAVAAVAAVAAAAAATMVA